MSDGYYQCDRCGKFERGPQKRSLSSLTDYADEEYRRITYGHRGENEDSSLSNVVDLCESCRRALTDWLEAGDES